MCEFLCEEFKELVLQGSATSHVLATRIGKTIDVLVDEIDADIAANDNYGF